MTSEKSKLWTSLIVLSAVIVESFCRIRGIITHGPKRIAVATAQRLKIRTNPYLASGLPYPKTLFS
jgi:hypothetical protein